MASEPINQLNPALINVPGTYIPDSKVHGANMEPIWVLSAPDGPHVGPMNLAIRDANSSRQYDANL